MGIPHRPARRRVLVGLGGVLAAALCAVGLAAPPAQAATTAWRTDGYGPQNSGFNPIETAINVSTVDRVAYRWSVVSPVVRLTCSRQAPPVVAGGRLFVTDQGGIAAHSASTGARLWTYRFAEPFDEVTPKLTVIGSRLFAAFNGCISQSDPDGQLIAFDAGSGSVLWRTFRDTPIDAMVVDRDVIAVAGEDVFGPFVTGYRVTDGALLWDFEGRMREPVSANGRLLVARPERVGSDLLDIRTGAVLWSSPTAWSVLAAGPAGGPLYAAGPAGELVRINVETGAVVWTQPGAAGRLAVDGPRLYVANGNDLVTRDSATGGVVWSRSYPAALGKPVVAGGVAYATVHGRFVEPLNAATGESVDSDPPYDGAVGHPVVVNGWLYVTNGRVLDAYRL